MPLISKPSLDAVHGSDSDSDSDDAVLVKRKPPQALGTHNFTMPIIARDSSKNGYFYNPGCDRCRDRNTKCTYVQKSSTKRCSPCYAAKVMCERGGVSVLLNDEYKQVWEKFTKSIGGTIGTTGRSRHSSSSTEQSASATSPGRKRARPGKDSPNDRNPTSSASASLAAPANNEQLPSNKRRRNEEEQSTDIKDLCFDALFEADKLLQTYNKISPLVKSDFVTRMQKSLEKSKEEIKKLKEEHA